MNELHLFAGRGDEQRKTGGQMKSELHKQAIAKIDRTEVGKLAAWLTLNTLVNITGDVIAFRSPVHGEAWMGESGIVYYGESSQERPILAQDNSQYYYPSDEETARINKEGPFPGRVSKDMDHWYTADIHCKVDGKWLATVGKHTDRWSYAQVIK